jgi:hypothetical protein
MEESEMLDTQSEGGEQVRANGNVRGDEFTRDLFRWLQLVATDRALPPGAASLAIVLSQYINRKSGTAWPTQETLGRVLATTTRAIRRNVEALVAHGHLSVTVARGRHRPNIYRLVLKFGMPPTAAAPQKPDSAVPLSEPENRTLPPENRIPLGKKQDGPVLQNHLKEPTEEPSEGEILSPPPLLSESNPTERTSTPPTQRPEEPPNDGFDRFWAIYPRHVAKGAARRAFTKALKRIDIDTLIDGARRYGAETSGREPRFIAHGATWLSGERWLDEPATLNGRVIDQWGNSLAAGAHRKRRRRSYTDIANEILEGIHERH